MATVTVNVPTDIQKKLADGDLTIGRFFIDVFDSDKAIKTEICASLLAFHDDVGGSPEIESLEIDQQQITFDAVTNSGKILFRYRVRFYYGCADINKDEPANERSDFEIDNINNKLLVHIHDPIRRDTIDEF
ncbi:hypothetical protein [Mucilaginibacter sp. UYCu711]|uniref:hypothetical protein n=1 Tax=Mucilaginibacter sp. UYCu711 TaxID=3156339 RepID=UPI003D1B6F87